MNRYRICFYDNVLRLTVLKRRNVGVTLSHFIHWRDQTSIAQLLAGRGIVTVERARWPATPPPAVCAETRCPGSYSRKQIVPTIEKRSYDLRRWYNTTYSQNVLQSQIVS